MRRETNRFALVFIRFHVFRCYLPRSSSSKLNRWTLLNSQPYTRELNVQGDISCVQEQGCLADRLQEMSWAIALDVSIGGPTVLIRDNSTVVAQRLSIHPQPISRYCARF